MVDVYSPRKKQPLTVVSASEKPQHDIDKHCQKLVLDAKDDIISVSNLTLPQEPHCEKHPASERQKCCWTLLLVFLEVPRECLSVIRSTQLNNSFARYSRFL
ncbi:hypothetical protein ACLKA7_003427 [Drosophila subpalustris]